MAAIRDVIVIGGGASGMMAAIGAARQGSQVTVLEKEEKPGRKLLATGNGKCNFTNEYQGMECYYSKDKAFVSSVLERFGKTETLAFFQELGIYPMEKNGYYYPHSGQAESVVRLLQREMERLKIKIKCQEQVKDIRFQEGRFLVETATYTYEGKRVILAAGGKASPVLGSDGSGYRLAEKLGHQITPLYPGLTGLTSKEVYFSKLAGVRAQGKVSLLENGTLVQEEKGEIQLTAYGLSGIPVFQLCHRACEGIDAGKKMEIVADFLPELSEEAFLNYIGKVEQRSPGVSKKELYAGIFDRKLAEVLAKKGRAGGKALRIELSGSRGFEQAQVTAGGVPLFEIEKATLESKKVPGLYLTGELLDVDGICGGYNLQWAWSTGFLAGEAAGSPEPGEDKQTVGKDVKYDKNSTAEAEHR